MKYRIKNVTRRTAPELASQSPPESELITIVGDITQEEYLFPEDTAAAEGTSQSSNTFLAFLRSPRGRILTAVCAAAVALIAIFVPTVLLISASQKSTHGGGTEPTSDGTVVNCNHEFEQITIKEPTCTKEGTAKNVCKLCNFVRDQVTLEALGHNMRTKITKEADCENEGEKKRTCALCGKEEIEVIPPKGHYWLELENERVEATCAREGKYVQMCTNCSKRETHVIEKLPHTMQAPVTVAPTCTQDGSKTSTCSVCGYKEIQTTEPATGHTYAPATCQSPEKCTQCGQTRGTTVGHRYTNGVCVTCWNVQPADGLRSHIALQNTQVDLGELVFIQLGTNIDLVTVGGTQAVCVPISIRYSVLPQQPLSTGSFRVTAPGSTVSDLLSSSENDPFALPSAPGIVNGTIYLPYHGVGEYLLDFSNEKVSRTFSINVSPLYSHAKTILDDAEKLRT